MTDALQLGVQVEEGGGAVEVNKMTNAELLTAHRSIAANTSQWELVMAAETELLRRLEHGQGAQPETFCKHCELKIYLDHASDPDNPPKWRHHASNFVECFQDLDTWAEPAAPPEQPQGSVYRKNGIEISSPPITAEESEHAQKLKAQRDSAGLADRGEALEWERNIHEQLDTLGAPRKSVDGFDFSINGRFAFLRYRAADPAQGQMSAREFQEAAEFIYDSLVLTAWDRREGYQDLPKEKWVEAAAKELQRYFAEAFARSQGEKKNG